MLNHYVCVRQKCEHQTLTNRTSNFVAFSLSVLRVKHSCGSYNPRDGSAYTYIRNVDGSAYAICMSAANSMVSSSNWNCRLGSTQCNVFIFKSKINNLHTLTLAATLTDCTHVQPASQPVSRPCRQERCELRDYIVPSIHRESEVLSVAVKIAIKIKWETIKIFIRISRPELAAGNRSLNCMRNHWARMDVCVCVRRQVHFQE